MQASHMGPADALSSHRLVKIAKSQLHKHRSSALRSRTICTALSHQAVYQTGSRYMSRPLARQKKAKDDLKGKGREENRHQF